MEYFLYEGEGSSEIELGNLIKKICLHMGDELSKELYINRFMYSLLLDNHYLRRLLLLTEAGKNLEDLLEKWEGEVYIYAAGRRGGRLAQTFPTSKLKGFIDANKTGEFCGLPVLSIKDFAAKYKKGKTLIIVSCRAEQNLIGTKLNEIGVSSQDIRYLDEWNEMASKGIYFDKRCLDGKKCSTGFIDCGSFDGESIEEFINWSGNKNAMIYAFEPEKQNYEMCKKYESDSIKVYKVGVSDVPNKLYITNEGTQASILNEEKEGCEQIDIVSLDQLCANKSINFIKMDIEGFEAKALKGAKKIISQQHPLLAVSIYHKREDIWEIPQLILSLYDNYKFYLGHYSIGMTDTVLYAVPED